MEGKYDKEVLYKWMKLSKNHFKLQLKFKGHYSKLEQNCHVCRVEDGDRGLEGEATRQMGRSFIHAFLQLRLYCMLFLGTSSHRFIDVCS